MINGNDPANPMVGVGFNTKTETVSFASDGGDFDANFTGLTKREYFAGLAMAGLCANGNIRDDVFIGKLSVQIADAVMEALNWEDAA